MSWRRRGGRHIRCASWEVRSRGEKERRIERGKEVEGKGQDGVRAKRREEIACKETETHFPGWAGFSGWFMEISHSFFRMFPTVLVLSLVGYKKTEKLFIIKHLSISGKVFTYQGTLSWAPHSWIQRTCLGSDWSSKECRGTFWWPSRWAQTQLLPWPKFQFLPVTSCEVHTVIIPSFSEEETKACRHQGTCATSHRP